MAHTDTIFLLYSVSTGCLFWVIVGRKSLESEQQSLQEKRIKKENVEERVLKRNEVCIQREDDCTVELKNTLIYKSEKEENKTRLKSRLKTNVIIYISRSVHLPCY